MDLGQSRRGVDMGPSALRGAGLQARIKQLGTQVEDIGNRERPRLKSWHQWFSIRHRFAKLKEDFDPTNRIAAMTRLSEAHDKGEVLTGIFYVNTKAPSFLDMLNMVDQPLATLPESVTRPGREALEAAMEELR